MNEYKIYELLCKLRNIGEHYNDGLAYAERVKGVAKRMETQLYRVAVIGEFKRGKSSLINALLGTNILPTDILPMTAALTRVTYGPQQRILICFKDGRTEEHSVEQLINFATKYDEEKEKTANSIREIQVTYPSVFLKNHIDIIDTPGINDNESMTKVTLGVLGDIDAAIFVVSALSPLSSTEQELLLTIIKEQGIRHIVFAVTHIDSVSDDEEDKDRIIELIKKRISENLVKKAETVFQEDADLLSKAYKVLKDPDIFGVSSTQALSAFLQDKEDLLNKSRFPLFKTELLTMLTAAQTNDIHMNAKDALNEMNGNIDCWYNDTSKALSKEKETFEKMREAYSDYFSNSGQKLISLFCELDDELRIPEQINQLRADALNIYIGHLSSIKQKNNEHNYILSALQTAYQEVWGQISLIYEGLNKWIDMQIHEINERYIKLKPAYDKLEAESDYINHYNNELSAWECTNEFLKPYYSDDFLSVVDNLKGVNIMPLIKDDLDNYLDIFKSEIDSYIASWRLVLLQFNKNLSSSNRIMEGINSELIRIDEKINRLNDNYVRDQAELKRINDNI